MPVCHAIQHAHQKGIIHRDIKPSNVLVTVQDDRPVPKVIDFGVAKATAQRLTERTLFTQLGVIVGTPEYMSPEQSQMNALDIDTRSDIYSLGVLLYELLTGSTPLAKERLREQAFTEVMRRIREEEPPKPSTRLGTTLESSNIAAQRGMEPAKLARLMRGDLDWIVMKALEKDRTRRYESASGMARDIQRYLQDEPVEASPPSTGYRLRKFAWKHRSALAAAATFASVLAIGAGVSTWQAWKAMAAGRRAVAAQRGEAEQRKEAEAVLRFVQDHVFAAARPVDRPGGLGPDVTLRQALESAIPVVEQSFVGQPLVEARLCMTLGMSFWYLGDARTAAGQFRRARAIFTDRLGPDHPDTLESMHDLATACAALGDEYEAFQLREETLARRIARLGPEHVDTLRSRLALARSYVVLNRYDDALELDKATVALMEAGLGSEHSETLQAMNNLANDYGHLRRVRPSSGPARKVAGHPEADAGPRSSRDAHRHDQAGQRVQ